MDHPTYPPLDIVPYWSRLNDALIQLVDLVPDEQINWSPKPELWNFRGILLHIAGSRDYWMGRIVQDGDPAPSAYETARSKEEIKREYLRTWERLQRFLSDAEKVGATYEDVWYGEPQRLSGHWIAYHLLEHDIHHRGDIFHYLALLGIEHPNVTTP